MTEKKKNSWRYLGEPVEVAPEGYEGFIYFIYNDTKDMFYVGRKSFYSYSKKKLTIAEKKLPENKRKIFKVEKKKTLWENYTGSSKELNEHIKEGDVIRKVIVRLCKTRKAMTAWETKHIFCDCFGKDNCYNGHALGKIFKKDFDN